MLRKDSIDFGFITHEVRQVCFLQHATQVSRKAFVAYIAIRVQIPRKRASTFNA
jgi:hypothetical protein